MIPTTLGITLDEALKQSTDLKKEYESDSLIRELIDIAKKLEGTNRNAGTHAAGVVIANGPLTDYVPLQRVVRKGDDGEGNKGEAVVTTQWVMGDLEKVGLLKMDFLGLRTLTLLDNAVKLIEKTRGEKIDIYSLPLDDRATYELLQRGDARGVFQFESDGIRELLKRMKPDNIRDIIACTALYRPGPLGGGMVDAYVNRKHGREKSAYPHPIMEEVLGETFAVMVYQEQVMRILNRLGGIELSSAYACIKAISKKKQEIIDQRKADFITGAQAQGISEQMAREIFDLIVYFGGYGFNKSHSAAYAFVSYQTAYLKAHYPAEFMAALLSSETDDRDSMVIHIDDARRSGVDVLPPNVNTGDVEFTVKDEQILFGLTAIKGVGRGAAAEVVRTRQQGGPYKDLFDFCERVDLKAVPRAAMERLIKAGAFDRLCPNRRQLWESLPRAVQVAGEMQDDARHGQRNFFDVFESSAPEAAPENTAALPAIPEWPTAEKLKYEKEALDFYFSSHPLAQHDDDIRRFATHTVSQLADMGAGQEVVIGGMLTQIRYMNTKKARNGNSRYARCKVEDFTGAAECVMWPDDFVRFKDEFQEDRVCFVKGAVERTREEPGLVLTRVMSVDQAKKELTRFVVLSLSLDQHGDHHIDRLAALFRQHRGPCPVELHLRDPRGRRARLKVGNDFYVNAAQLPVKQIEEILGPNRVAFFGLAGVRNSQNGNGNGNGSNGNGH
jgi:DNA polymerase-3 subunit alpha